MNPILEEIVFPLLITLVVLYGFYRLFKGFFHNIRQTKGKDMLLIFDALYETIKDSNDSDLKVIYSDLAKKYRDDKNEFINTDSNKLFMLKRDARIIFLDIKRIHPDLKTIIEVKNDCKVVLDTGVLI